MVGGKRITSVDDSSVEAILLKELWPMAVDDTIAARDWSFARKVSELMPIVDPTGEDRATFAIPLNAAVIRHVGSDVTVDNELDWEIENGVILIKNALGSPPSVAWARYTVQTREPGLFDAPFTACLAARLAMELAIPIANSGTLFDRLVALYNVRLMQGATTNSMQGKRVPFQHGNLIRAHSR
jgi:hypothetical protein